MNSLNNEILRTFCDTPNKYLNDFLRAFEKQSSLLNSILIFLNTTLKILNAILNARKLFLNPVETYKSDDAIFEQSQILQSNDVANKTQTLYDIDVANYHLDD